MFTSFIKKPFFAALALLVGLQFSVADSHARTAFTERDSAIGSFASNGNRPVAGRNRRGVAVAGYRGLYPKAMNDRIFASTQVSKLRINVLSNDRGNGLKIRKVNNQSAKGGRVFLQGSHVVYQPTKNFKGWDSFWYSIVDRNGRRHSAKVNICLCDR